MKTTLLLRSEDDFLNVKCTLSHDGTVSRLETAHALFLHLELLNPSFMLLEAELPDASGFDVCREIKQNPQWADLVVVIVGNSDNAQQSLETALDAGAKHFLPRSYTLPHANALVESFAESASLKRQLTHSHLSIASLIENNSASGQILHTVRRSCAMSALDSLAQLILDHCRSSNLDAVLQHRGTAGVLIQTTSGSPASTEQLFIIEQALAGGSVYNIDACTAFTRDALTLLVTNMPTYKPDIYGQIKDNFALLVDCMASRFSNAELQDASISLQSNMVASVDLARSSLMDVQVMRYRQMVDMITSVEDLIQNLRDIYPSLILTERQESMLESLADASLNSVLEIQGQGLETDVEMERALASLKAAAAVELPISQVEVLPEDEADIELF